MDRRSVLRSGLLGAGGLLAAGATACAPARGCCQNERGPFDCGVASGVHSDTTVVLWTRFAPGALAATSVRWTVTADGRAPGS